MLKLTTNKRDIMSHFPRIYKYPVDFSQPNTHIFMLRNVPKYRSFSNSLRKVAKGKTVIDLGAGCGILSLICVAHGAEKIFAVDRHPISKLLTEVVLQYPNVSKKIEIVESDIFDLNLDGHCFDIIISETIVYVGFEENILPILSAAKRYWASNSTILLPSKLRAIIQPSGSDIQNSYESPYLNFNEINDDNFVMISNSKPITFNGYFQPRISLNSNWKALNDTSITNLSLFFDAELSEGTKLNNRVNKYWPHVTIPLSEKLSLKLGQQVDFELFLEPDSSGCYSITISAKIEKKNVFTNKFYSTEIKNPLIPVNHSSVNDVKLEVKRVLSELKLLRKAILGPC